MSHDGALQMTFIQGERGHRGLLKRASEGSTGLMLSSYSRNVVWAATVRRRHHMTGFYNKYILKKQFRVETGFAETIISKDHPKRGGKVLCEFGEEWLILSTVWTQKDGGKGRQWFQKARTRYGAQRHRTDRFSSGDEKWQLGKPEGRVSRDQGVWGTEPSARQSRAQRAWEELCSCGLGNLIRSYRRLGNWKVVHSSCSKEADLF